MSRPNSISDLLDERESLKIPKFQREYQGTEENINDMFLDIKRTARSNDNSHYFGTIVTAKINDKNRKDVKMIVDGQQRKLTTTLFIKAFCSKLSDIYEEATKQLDGENLKKFKTASIETMKDSIEEDVVEYIYYERSNNYLVFISAEKHRDSYKSIMKTETKFLETEDIATEHDTEITYEHVWCEDYDKRPTENEELDNIDEDEYKNIVEKIGNRFILTKTKK